MKIEIETDGTHPRQLVEAARFLCSLANQGSAHRWNVVEELSHEKFLAGKDSTAGTPTHPNG